MKERQAIVAGGIIYTPQKMHLHFSIKQCLSLLHDLIVVNPGCLHLLCILITHRDSPEFPYRRLDESDSHYRVPSTH